jgi:cytidylate kinase
VDGRPLDADIRGTDVTAAVSTVAAVAAVRTALVERQREIIQQAGRIVVEGRDISAVVWPKAELKVYLTASEQERARRRGIETGGDLAATQASIARRDALDSARAKAAGERLDGATEVDTTGLDIDGVVAVLQSMLAEAVR